MKGKRFVCLLLSIMLSLGCYATSVAAVELPQETGAAAVRATGSFNMTLSSHTIKTASTSFPLESNEMVTIKASYSPFSASVDFGLIGPDGKFHYVRVTSGTVSQTIRINTSGNYTLAIRNNSSQTVRVSGFVNY